MKEIKDNQIHWKDLFLGLFLGVALCSLVMVAYIPKLILGSGANANVASGSSSSTDESTPSVTTEHKTYATDIQDWTLTPASGESLQYTTPSGWYSLTDQYIDSLKNYYEVEVDDTNLVCVGDNAAQYQSTMTINAAALSKLREIMSLMYADNPDINVDELQYSEAYVYMTTGELPEGIDDSFTIEEKDSIEKDGITYRTFLVGYDTEYYKDDTQTETTTVHTDELMAYSSTEDPVEIVVYMSEWDTDAAMTKLQQFINGTN